MVADDGEVRGTVTLAAGSLETGNRHRDAHLRSPAFFAADTYPDITFTADRVEPDGQAATLTGRLTIRGSTRPVTLAAQVTGVDEIRLDGTAEVDRAEFGLDWNPLGVTSTRNLVEIEAVFVRR